MTYHANVQMNIHDVESIHVYHKGRVWKESEGESKYDVVESTDVIVKTESGQGFKITMFHGPGIVPTFSSWEQEQAEEAAAKAEADAATDAAERAAALEKNQEVTS